jgi:excinuclease UvrABC ATPase subunit
MTIREALMFFKDVAKLVSRLKVLDAVGLVISGLANLRRLCPAAKLSV